MNIYDFDKTIYDGDSTADFIKYCACRYKRACLWAVPTLWAFFLYVLGIYSKTRFKERMYGFLKMIPDIDEAVNDFWDKHEHNILEYYKKQRKEDDIIISASPKFLLEPICKRLGIKDLIASRVDKKTGKYSGENCWGPEKVRRLKDEYGITGCDEFYSDSFSDGPLASIAKKAFIVRKNELTLWNEYKETGKEKFIHMFASPEFLMFLFIGIVNTFNGILFSWLYSLIINALFGERPLNANIAFVIGYITSMVISYILNSKLTFKEKLSFVKYVKFFISYMPNFIIQNIMVAVFHNWIGIPELPVYALAAVIGVPVTFVIMKLFAFRKKKSK